MALLLAAAACGRNDNSYSDSAYGGTTTGVSPITPVVPAPGMTTGVDTMSMDSTRRDTTNPRP
jgi:hypothetical protein